MCQMLGVLSRPKIWSRRQLWLFVAENAGKIAGPSWKYDGPLENTQPYKRFEFRIWRGVPDAA